MGCFAGREALGQLDNTANSLPRKRRLTRRPRLVLQERVHTRLHIPFLPAPDAGLGLACPPHNLRCAAPGTGEKNDVRPPDMLLRAVAIRNDRLKPSTIRSGDLEGNSSSHAARLAQFAPNGNPKSDSYVR